MAKLSTDARRIVAGMKARMHKVIDMHLEACGHAGPLAEAYQYEDDAFRWLREKLAELEGGK